MNRKERLEALEGLEDFTAVVVGMRNAIKEQGFEENQANEIVTGVFSNMRNQTEG